MIFGSEDSLPSQTCVEVMRYYRNVLPSIRTVAADGTFGIELN